MKSRAGLWPLAILAALAVAGCARSAQGERGVPADFKIHAQFSPGYSVLRPWNATLTHDGQVTQEYSSAEDFDVKKTTSLSRQDLLDLIQQFREADFFALKERYTYQVTDNPTLVLSITRAKETHTVKVYAPEHLAEDPDVKRFLMVWSEFLRKVPPPLEPE